jgi:hypothetical protein
MNALTQVLAERSSHAERNDCSVVALSIAVGIPYDVAHHMLASAGRKPGHGFKMTVWLREQAELGGIVCGYKFTTVQADRRTLARVRRDFPKGRLMVTTRGHIFAMIDGVILDPAYTGERSQVRFVTLVERA